MNLRHPKLSIALLIYGVILSGCRNPSMRPIPPSLSDHTTNSLQTLSAMDTFVQVDNRDQGTQLGLAAEPRTLKDMAGVERWELTLEDAIGLSLSNSTVLRDLGGTVVRSPAAIQTAFDPAIRETDPRLGVEAALSAFDAQIDAALSSEKIDRRLNNRFVGDVGFLTGQASVWDSGISKRTASGTRFALNHHIDHERDNNPGNQFPGGAWNVWYDAEARQALLQGGGVNFNRIAGPDASPGIYNGITIARIRADVSLAEFEIGLRDFISNVENSYWDLYYSYRDLDAKVRARDAALETWRQIEALNASGRRGGEAEKEAQAREQYFRFEAEAQDSLAGRPLDGTRTSNGSLPGTFRGLPGVLVNEKRLRLIMNEAADPVRLICPIDEPPAAAVVFDWPSATTEALTRRGELRRQRLIVNQSESELIAAKNFLLPQLDVFGRYRVRGFGNSLLDPRSGQPRFDNAYQDLTSGDFAEWQAGLEYTAPVGFRQAHAAVRNAELKLTRERAIMRSQQEEIIYGLSLAIAELDRAQMLKQTNYNRYLAANQQVIAVEAAYEDDRVEFIAVLDARRRLAEAESQHYRSQAEYAVALKNVHFEKGTLLDYDRIASVEGPWPGQGNFRALGNR